MNPFQSGTYTVQIKWTEFGLLFCLLPLAYSFLFPQLPLFVVLALGAAFALLLLYVEGLLTLPTLLHWERKRVWPITARFLVFALFFGLATWYLVPDKLFSLAIQKPGLMLLILVLYPLLSVVPQELMFRTLYFERYAGLFPGELSAVIVNALLFGLAHLLFGNVLAVLASAVLSFAISYNYLKHRSLLLAVYEHALYGNFMFLIGVGEYFYKV